MIELDALDLRLLELLQQDSARANQALAEAFAHPADADADSVNPASAGGLISPPQRSS